MKKDPAVLFYTADFLAGTILMTYEQVGKYIKLLCLQHQKGRLTEKEMLVVCEGYDEDIFSKFQKDEDGKYYNARMEEETNKRKKYVESRSNNRKSTKKTEESKPTECVQQSYVQTYGETYVQSYEQTYEQHMGNENENINGNILYSNGNEDIPIVRVTKKRTKREFTPPTYEQVIEYAKERGYEHIAKPFFDYFNEGEWVDSVGNKVRNWKQKFISWCEREPKQPTATKKEEKQKQRYGNFDPEEAFKKALDRSLN